jgi:hypothetical protein
MIKIEKDMFFFDDKIIIDAEYTVLPNEENIAPVPLTLFHMVTPSP